MGGGMLAPDAIPPECCKFSPRIAFIDATALPTRRVHTCVENKAKIKDSK